jgi:hypothetical protein
MSAGGFAQALPAFEKEKTGKNAALEYINLTNI